MRSETCLKSILLYAAIVLFSSGYAMADTWTTLDNVTPRGISGDNIVGSGAGDMGFLYNMNTKTWTTLNPIGATRSDAYGINGNKIVGQYWDTSTTWGLGFLNDGTSWTTLVAPAGDFDRRSTCLRGISGDNIVGYDQQEQGFLYNATNQNWTKLHYPGALNTLPMGIDGSNIVGYYYYAGTFNGFLYNGTTWTPLTMQGVQSWGTYVTGISGNNIVGYYERGADHGFLYDGTTWTTLDYPGATSTQIYGISDNSVVGYYEDSSGVDHGFIYTIPEPATLLLLGLGAVIARRKRS